MTARRALLLTIGAPPLPAVTPVVPIAGTWMPAVYTPPDEPGPVLEIVGGEVIVNCRYDDFFLSLSANAVIPEVGGFINVDPQEVILIEIEQVGGFTFGLPSNCTPVSGVPFEMPSGAGAVVVLGLKTFDGGATWRYTVQQPAAGAPSVTLAPSPASDSVETDGTTATAPSVQVTATVAGGTAPITHAWARIDTAGGTSFLIDDAAAAAPTFSIAAGTTAYGPVTQRWRDTVTDAASLTSQAHADVILERVLNAPPPPVVAISDQNINAAVAAPNFASAGYLLSNNGTAYRDGNTGLQAISDEWLNGGTASDYEVMFDQRQTVGTPNTTGTFDVWQGLGIARSVYTEVGGGGHQVATVTFRARIRRVSDGAVLDTATITLNVESSL